MKKWSFFRAILLRTIAKPSCSRVNRSRTIALGVARLQNGLAPLQNAFTALQNGLAPLQNAFAALFLVLAVVRGTIARLFRRLSYFYLPHIYEKQNNHVIKA